MFKSLFIPSDDYFLTKFNSILEKLGHKLEYNSYLDVFSSVNNLISGDKVPENPSFSMLDQTFELPIFSAYGLYRERIFGFIRGFLYPLFLFFQLNTVYKLIRSGSLTDSGKNSSGGDKK